MRILLLCLLLTGCRAGYDSGNFTIKTYGETPQVITTSRVKLTDEENKIDYIDENGKKKTVTGSFELYENN